jgi:hypothetical protein
MQSTIPIQLVAIEQTSVSSSFCLLLLWHEHGVFSANVPKSTIGVKQSNTKAVGASSSLDMPFILAIRSEESSTKFSLAGHCKPPAHVMTM